MVESTPETPQKFATVRVQGVGLTSAIMQGCPPCPERDKAIRKVEEATAWANAAIARSLASSIPGFDESCQNMAEAFLNEPELLEAYESSIATMMLDRHGVADMIAAKSMAFAVIQLVFFP